MTSTSHNSRSSQQRRTPALADPDREGSLREKWVAVPLGLLLIAQGWNLGGVSLTAQAWNLVLAAAALYFSLVRLSRVEGGQDAAGQVRRWIRHPGFWLYGFFLGYVVLQGLNPAWLVRFEGETYRLSALESRTGWPASFLVEEGLPYGKSTPWVFLLPHLSVWAVCGAVWVTFRRRRSLVWLCWLSGVNAALVAAFGIFQRMQGKALFSPETLTQNLSYFATFIYPNHAAVYFYLNICLLLAAALYHFGKGGRGGRLASLGVGLSLLPATGVFLAFSRGGMLACLLLYAGFVVCLLYQVFFVNKRVSPRLLGASMGVLALLGIAALVLLLNERVAQRLAAVQGEIRQLDTSPRYRLSVATLEMAGDRWLWGWGAGGFRYAFPVYQETEPVLMTLRPDLETPTPRPLWRFAHNDWAQYLAELGLLGAGAFMLATSSWWWAVRGWRLADGVVWMLLVGWLLMGLHAFFDFLVYSPPLLLLWSVLGATGGKYLQLSLRQRSAF